EQAGLPVMFLAPGNGAPFASIAERHPGLQLIVDHMNLSVDIARENRIAAALDQTVALAKYPNVSVKMSSAPTYSSEPYPYRDMLRYPQRVFVAFGPWGYYLHTDLSN